MISLDLNIVYLIISSVTLIAAIASPIVTAIINNRHQSKLRRLEIVDQRTYEQQQHDSKMVESILMNLGAAAHYADQQNLGNYGRYFALAFQYLPECCHDHLKKLNAAIIRYDHDASAKAYEELAIMLSPVKKDC